MSSKRLLYAFYGRPSANPLKIAILLEELGLNYELSKLSRETNEHQGVAHTARHPNSKVPVVTDINGITTWETMSIALCLISEYDTGHVFSSPEKQEMANMMSWYSLQSTSLAPFATLYLNKQDISDLDPSRPYFRSEILRMLGILDSHLTVSKSGFISPHGYSFADSGWAVYTDHYVQKGVGFVLDDFPGVKKWHERIYERPAVVRAYQKLGVVHEAW